MLKPTRGEGRGRGRAGYAGYAGNAAMSQVLAGAQGSRSSKSQDELGSKEKGLFKQMMKLHEIKQYKKGIKMADKILGKAADNGETLAMKGLMLSGLKRKEEAHECAKRGVQKDAKSHVCWHVYGLILRADQDYKKATWCYQRALACNPDSLGILRDVATLQMHCGDDAQGLIKTRQQLMRVQPSVRSNWVGLRCVCFFFACFAV